MKSCSMMNAVFFAWRMNLCSELTVGFKLDSRLHDSGRGVPLDDLACNDTLFGVKEAVEVVSAELAAQDETNVRAGLINEVDGDVWLAQRKHDSDALEFSSGKRFDILVQDGLQIHRFDDVRVELWVHKHALDPLQQQHSNGTCERW